ncbi:MAG: hypothetical protein ABI894_14890 [Ilumatobacteraceae bacterium]
MRIPRNQTVVAFVLLLASCGAAAASQSDPSGSSSEPHVSAPAANESPTTLALPITGAESAFPARLSLTTTDGKVLTFSPDADPLVTDGVISPTGKVVVSASFMHGRTMIEWHDVKTDIISGELQVDGEFRPAAVSQDGKLVALIGTTPTSTTVVLATPSGGEMRRWTFDGLLVPEAFANAYEPNGDGLPIGVFVIEYLDTNTYRVRVIDTATGELGLPLNLRDKSQTVDEIMTAVSRTAVFEPTNQLLFTLYQDATEGDGEVGSFIHTLGLVNGVWCLDVPEQLGLADHAGALTVSPDGSRLYAASSIGGVAGYVVSDVITNGPDMPKARTTVALGASAKRVAIGASRDEVVVALGGSLFRLDPVNLVVRDSFVWDMDVEALTVLEDGSIVIVGTGRMTVVSPQNELLAERALPYGATEVTRVAVVG